MNCGRSGLYLLVALAATLGAPALSLHQPSAQIQTVNLRPAGPRSVTLGSYRVRVFSQEVGADTSDATSTPWGATEKDASWRLVSSLEIWLGKDRIEVPRSAFADLADARLLMVKGTPRGVLLSILGGEAAYAYRADIQIEGKRVTHRSVRSVEFPDIYYEQTRYVEHFPPGM